MLDSIIKRVLLKYLHFLTHEMKTKKFYPSIITKECDTIHTAAVPILKRH